MENRIEQKLQTLQEKREKAFITYMTAGLPDMAGCKALIQAQEHLLHGVVRVLGIGQGVQGRAINHGLVPLHGGVETGLVHMSSSFVVGEKFSH